MSVSGGVQKMSPYKIRSKRLFILTQTYKINSMIGCKTFHVDPVVVFICSKHVGSLAWEA